MPLPGARGRALLLALGALLLAGCSDPEPPAAPTEVTARMDHEGAHFDPPVFATTVGKPVRFVVAAGNHTVDFALGEGAVYGVDKPHSGDLGPGESASVSFSQRGQYKFFCRYHSAIGPDAQRTGMQGFIQVT